VSYLDGRRSAFPENVDQFVELRNLPPSQRANLKRLQELILKESLTTSEQEELNNLEIILQNYRLDVEKWNKGFDAIVNMQNFFKTDVEPYVDDMKTDVLAYTNTKKQEMINYVDTKQQEFQTEINRFVYRGDWQPNIQYYAKNVVTVAGEGYIAMVDNINKQPPNTNYWAKIAKKGEKGDPSLNINYKGDYEENFAYTLGDAVTYGGLWYYAKQNTKGNPPTNATYWELQANQVLVSDTEPFDNRIVGWIDTSI